MAIIDRDGVRGKVCPRCKQWKPSAEFSPRIARGVSYGDGLQSICKLCFNIRQRARRQLKHEETLAYERAYRERNREKLRAYDREHYLRNRERHNELIRIGYHKDPEKKLSRIRAYLKANPDKAAAKSNRRRAKEHAAQGSHTIAEWRALKARYDYTCLCCGRREPAIELTRDHIVPLDQGGSDEIANIQPLCRPCNGAKGARAIDYRPRVEGDPGGSVLREAQATFFIAC
jgi:5-methylcytosine-specific restriction endonuclease McrA